MSLHAQLDAFKQRGVAQPSVLRSAARAPAALELPAKQEAPPPPPDARPDHLVMLDMHRILRFLKETGKGHATDRPQTIDAIAAASGIRLDPQADPQLWERMTNNTKIIYDAAASTFLYKPDIAVNTKEELCELLRARLLEGSGLDLTQRTHDSNLDIKQAVRELEEEGRVLVLRTADKKHERMVFYNETQYDMHVDEDFAREWHQLTLPDPTEMARQLQAKGHQVTKEKELDRKKDAKAKPKKRGGARKVKLTNAHMAHLFAADWKTA